MDPGMSSKNGLQWRVSPIVVSSVIKINTDLKHRYLHTIPSGTVIPHWAYSVVVSDFPMILLLRPIHTIFP